MELFGSYTSPYVRHCRIAFKETGLAYSFTETDHDMSAKLSPAKRCLFYIITICAFLILRAY